MPAWQLPWPRCTTNSLYKRCARGYRLSDRAVAWREEAIARVRQQRGLPLPDGPLQITLWIYPPADGRLHDGDNLLKLTQDSIALALGFDDSRIKQGRWYVVEGQPSPHLLVRLRGATQPEPAPALTLAIEYREE